MRFYRPLILLATILALFVVSLGAYVRLSDAGLGCPDWPGCYGHLLGVPEQAHEQARALEAFPERPVETHKAWKEMLHRYFAGGLGLLILLIACLAWRHRKPLGQSPYLATALLATVVFQAALGMWTVTLLLKPVIVSAHLLGGMTTLMLLVFLLLRQTRQPTAYGQKATRLFRYLAALSFVLILMQVVLGAWVSSNYAALACGDFPSCQGQWLPEMDFRHAFQLHRELGQTAEGAWLSQAALTAIHWTHRVGALLVFLLAGTFSLLLLRSAVWRAWGAALFFLLLAQISLGVANVLWSLPLPLAVAHNTGAALLLIFMVSLNSRLWSSRL
ncbi:MAG: COX15/CtaA family protein [Pseudomonadota bacterium]